MKPLTHASLFSGIGGVDLGAEAAGFETRFQCEINPFAGASSPHASLTVPFTATFALSGGDIIDACRGVPTVLSGGFPCQPVSLAGKRLGSKDDRWLWPEYLRLIRETHPPWIVAENVAALTSIPEFREIYKDLGAEGYEIRILHLRAADVGAPHIRARCFVVAHSDSERLQTRKDLPLRLQSQISGASVLRGNAFTDSDCLSGFQTNPGVCAFGGSRDARENAVRSACREGGAFSADSACERERSDTAVQGEGADEAHKGGETLRENASWEHWGCNALPDWSDYPPAVCRVDDVFSKGLDKSRLQALGNAVVPRCVFPIFDAIRRIEQEEY